MIKKQEIVLFDFDGTLSASDANAGFMNYCFLHSPRPWLFLPLVATALALKALSGEKYPELWRELLRRYLTADMVAKLAPEFIKLHRRKGFDWAKERIEEEHSSPDAKVLLISAGPDYLIKELARDMKFDAVICSETDPERPWKYKFLCRGQNKVAALDNWAKKNKALPIIVRSYADDKSDVPLMSLAHEQVWINPKTGRRNPSTP